MTGVRIATMSGPEEYLEKDVHGWHIYVGPVAVGAGLARDVVLQNVGPLAAHLRGDTGRQLQ